MLGHCHFAGDSRPLNPAERLLSNIVAAEIARLGEPQARVRLIEDRQISYF